MTDNILYLHPRDPQSTISTPALVDALRQIGFIGEYFEFRCNEHFKPGEEFLYLLTFLGCSPVVSLGEPGLTGREYCHVELTAPANEVEFIAGDNVKVPRCRHCNQRIDNWITLIDQWKSQGKSGWQCPHCGHTTPLHRLKWKHSAGFGRQFIKVWGIFEGEAVPGDELMNSLNRLSNIEWDYFYCRTHP